MSFAQEDIKTFSLPRNLVKVTGLPEQPKHVEIDFSRFEMPENKEKDVKQDEIHLKKNLSVGAKCFNINDLIKKGLFDAAEYFLGRPLTAVERIMGLMSAEELRQYNELEKKKATEKSVLESLAQLVQNTNQDQKKDEEKEEIEEKDNDDDSLNLDISDIEQEEDDDIIWDHKTKQRFIENFGEDTFLEQSQHEMEDWTPEEKDRYNHSLFGSFGPSSLPARPPIATVVKNLLPEYNEKTRYKIEDAKKLLKQWQKDFAEMAPAPRAKSKPALFQPMPSSAAEWQKRLQDASHEIATWHQNKPSQPSQSSQSSPASAPKIKGKGLNHKQVEWAPFGPKWMISPQLLHERDVLSIVKSSNKQKTPKHPNRTVSAAMKVCLLAVLAGQPIPTELLSADEQEWFRWLLDEAGIQHIKKPPQKLEIKLTPKQMKERLAVLYGEIAEGPNDNVLIKTEFKKLFNQASLRGLLNPNQLQNMQDFINTF